MFPLSFCSQHYPPNRKQIQHIAQIILLFKIVIAFWLLDLGAKMLQRIEIHARIKKKSYKTTLTFRIDVELYFLDV